MYQIHHMDVYLMIGRHICFYTMADSHCFWAILQLTKKGPTDKEPARVNFQKEITNDDNDFNLTQFLCH